MSIHTFPLDDHLVIFRPVDRRLFILNQLAAWIWQAAAGGLQVEEMVELMADHYGLPQKDIESDVQTTVDQWAQQGLVPAHTDETQMDSPSIISQPAANGMTLPGDLTIALQLHYRFGQSTFTLVDYTPELASHFLPLLANLPMAEKGRVRNRIELFKDGNDYVVCANQFELERSPLELVAVGRVVQAMIDFGYPETNWMAFIHASAGALEGYGIVFPGIGGSGKSTLMAALARSGWTYWCDDTVPLDTEGRAGGVPLNHCLKAGSWEVLAPYWPELGSLPVYQRCGKDVRYLALTSGQTDFTATLPVHAIVFPQYSPDSPQTIAPLSQVESLRLLFEAQSWMSPVPAHAGELIHWIKKIPAYSLSYTSLDWAKEKLKQLVEASGTGTG